MNSEYLSREKPSTGPTGPRPRGVGARIPLSAYRPPSLRFNGVGDGDRTHDIQLGKDPQESLPLVDVSGSSTSRVGTTVNEGEKASFEGETELSANCRSDSESADDEHFVRGGFE
jgi:hypothetical protein